MGCCRQRRLSRLPPEPYGTGGSRCASLDFRVVRTLQAPVRARGVTHGCAILAAAVCVRPMVAKTVTFSMSGLKRNPAGGRAASRDSCASWLSSPRTRSVRKYRRIHGGTRAEGWTLSRGEAGLRPRANSAPLTGSNPQPKRRHEFDGAACATTAVLFARHTGPGNTISTNGQWDRQISYTGRL
jgi:hypothetical protein